MLAQLTGFELTRGVLCAMHRPLLPTVEEVCRNARRVAVLEGIVAVSYTHLGYPERWGNLVRDISLSE